MSPFLMIDHFGPLAVQAGGAGGLNPHPHRGFETVTLLFEGGLEHHDSLGNHGVLRPGDVQWMTAAGGIVHAEYHEREFAKRGGTLQGIQLWVNLPARHKMDAPGYQDITAARIPEVALDGGVGSRDRRRVRWSERSGAHAHADAGDASEAHGGCERACTAAGRLERARLCDPWLGARPTMCC